MLIWNFWMKLNENGKSSQYRISRLFYSRRFRRETVFRFSNTLGGNLWFERREVAHNIPCSPRNCGNFCTPQMKIKYRKLLVSLCSRLGEFQNHTSTAYRSWRCVPSAILLLKQGKTYIHVFVYNYSNPQLLKHFSLCQRKGFWLVILKNRIAQQHTLESYSQGT